MRLLAALLAIGALFALALAAAALRAHGGRGG
jgi:hypothetical protein